MRNHATNWTTQRGGDKNQLISWACPDFSEGIPGSNLGVNFSVHNKIYNLKTYLDTKKAARWGWQPEKEGKLLCVSQRAGKNVFQTSQLNKWALAEVCSSRPTLVRCRQQALAISNLVDRREPYEAPRMRTFMMRSLGVGGESANYPHHSTAVDTSLRDS